jgi:hypothetical protein
MEANPSKSWWQQNRKWVIPVGIGVILLLCLVPLFCVAGVGASVFGLIKSSDVYQNALQEAQSHPAVNEALGEPVEPGWWVTGSIEVNNTTGNADFAVPLSGPKNSGTLYAVAFKEAGQWHFSRLEVEVQGQSERINLLNEPE